MSSSDGQKPSFTVQGLRASHFEIGGDKRIYRHLSASDSFNRHAPSKIEILLHPSEFIVELSISSYTLRRHKT
jgi:hypothetical protein